MSNPNVTITNTEILSKNWYILKKVTFDFKKKDGSVITQVREAYDRGNGAVIKISDVKKIFEAYMSPGSVTEILHFFIAEYSKDMKVNEGGGAEGEEENIEVLELPFDKAYKMIASGEIKDAKTMMLLQYAKINSLLDA
ncbi:MAG: GDP-mannose pyrophosphatase [Flavobacterium sp.]|nr:MAG: GDP-mannose pyrophosphatase [Flavobacterium sp.]